MSIMTNDPPAPIWLPFTTVQGEGCLLYPYPPRVPFYVDFRLEVVYTFSPFGDTQIYSLCVYAQYA